MHNFFQMTNESLPFVKEQEKSSKLVPGLIIFSLGSVLTYVGFNVGFKKQMKLALEEMSDNSTATQAMDQAGDAASKSAANARSLAVKALMRGSVVAAIMAMTAGIGLSFVVEAHHKGYSKEKQEIELTEIWRQANLSKEESAKERAAAAARKQE